MLSQCIKVKILSNENNKLQTICDALNEESFYNQIRFVLVCLIHELELLKCFVRRLLSFYFC